MPCLFKNSRCEFTKVLYSSFSYILWCHRIYIFAGVSGSRKPSGASVSIFMPAEYKSYRTFADELSMRIISFILSVNLTEAEKRTPQRIAIITATVLNIEMRIGDNNRKAINAIISAITEPREYVRIRKYPKAQFASACIRHHSCRRL